MLYLLGISKRWPPSTAAMRQRLNNSTHRNQRGAAKFSGLAAPPSVHLPHHQRARSSPSVGAEPNPSLAGIHTRVRGSR